MRTLQLAFTLRHPEQVDWSIDPDFNSGVHQRLLAARARILASTPAVDHRPRVEAALLRLRARSMAPRQQMLLHYLLTQSARARDLSRTVNFCQALEWCARAEEIARDLQDYGAQVDLYELRGTLHRAVSLYWIAAEEFSFALRMLREHAEDTASFDPEFEVTLAARAATMDYLLASFPRALEHLRRAEALLPLVATSVTGQGTIAWTFALLHRQRNELAEALRRVEEAAVLYLQAGTTNSTCRVLSLAADIAMDAAESSLGDEPAAREAYLTLAARYVEEAMHVGHEANDPSGLELGKLSLARLERLRDPDGATGIEERIRATLLQADQMDDESLKVAAQTALGVELIACGQREQGRRWLKQAVATARKIHALGLGFYALRRLGRVEGRNV